MHMATDTKPWTLEELHRLPDDGNKYELVRGELFVTPAPSVTHEMVLARLTALLLPYVERHSLGMIYHPRAVVRFEGSEVEPDLMVRANPSSPTEDWAKLPIPVLVVEVLSGTTRRRDLQQKRQFYLDAGVAEYWAIDPKARTVRVVKPGAADLVEPDVVTWHPPGASDALVVRVAVLLAE